MYGLINQSFEQMLREHFGQDLVDSIRVKAGTSEQIYLTNESYDDKITYDLIIAASEVLKIPLSDMLREFGRFWVLETAAKSYGSLMDAAGSTFEEFLLALPAFHTRVALIYPDLKPPVFRTSKIEEKKIILIYKSNRLGLEPFVIGVIEGLGIRFDCELSIELLENSENPNERKFEVTW